ncbi:MAG: CDP-alcohol phosphatidyltransferase family protein [Cyanobacteria bacterium P01_C01_bin.118]
MHLKSALTSPILYQLDLANGLTLMGLMLDFLCVILAINEIYYLAIICLIGVGLIDLFDGLVARKIKRNQLQASAGKQLDSLIDLCSFGFTPAIFAYCYGGQDPLSIVVLILYISANALRLAYFNNAGLTATGDQEYFTGLPVTYAALFIPLIFTFSLILPKDQTSLILIITYLLLALAMVINFKMPKLKGIWYGVFTLGAIALAGFHIMAFLLEIEIKGYLSANGCL